jgi:hypothetical protein|tara:strand:- start:672 stop:1004 length:333 start_codon:yes stop_codon:yes gene_type:complete
MRRVLDSDPATGITQWFHFDESTGDLGLETQQDVTSIVEHNKALFNQVDERARWSNPLRPSGGQTLLATVPTSIHHELMKITNNGKDQKALNKWLNDPDNRVFRTRPGRI